MSNNTQLPAEWLESIEMKAEHEAALQFHPVYSPDQNTACRICYRNGAKEYADLALLSIEEEKRAKRITVLALQSRSRAMKEYATKLHQAEQEKKDLKRRADMAIHLLTTVSKQCTMRRALLTEIKTFLDGAK